MTVLGLLGMGRYDCPRFVWGWGGMTVLDLLGGGGGGGMTVLGLLGDGAV